MVRRSALDLCFFNLFRRFVFFSEYLIQLSGRVGLVPDTQPRPEACLQNIQDKIMERLTVDFYEGKDERETTDERQERDKQGGVCQFIGGKTEEAAAQKNDKLSARDRAEDLVFNIDELWNRELIHITLSGYSYR